MEKFIFTAGASLFNARIKYYPSPDGKQFVAWDRVIFDRPIYNPEGLEKVAREAECRVFAPSSEEATANKRSAQRARTKVFDIIMANPDMNVFLTLTLNRQKISRTEWGEIVSRLNVWLDNRVRRAGLKYVLVPEYHDDGEAIHFHGMANEAGLELVNSGHKRNGRTVYNIADFPYGFTAAIRRGGTAEDVAKTSKYIFKYMTKQAEKIGGRYYLHGGKIDTPRYFYYVADTWEGLTPQTLDCGLLFARGEGAGEDKTTLSRLSPDFWGKSEYCCEGR